MMIIKDVVYCRKYQNKNGEEKKDYINVGSLFIKDDGGISIALKPWIDLQAFAKDGGEVWLQVYDRKEKGKKGASAEVQEVAQAMGGPVDLVPEAGFDDDVPF